MSAPTVVGQRDPEKAWAYKKDVAWYRTELSEETIGPMRPILELYSKVPPESVVEWIKTVVSFPPFHPSKSQEAGSVADMMHWHM